MVKRTDALRACGRTIWTLAQQCNQPKQTTTADNRDRQADPSEAHVLAVRQTPLHHRAIREFHALTEMQGVADLLVRLAFLVDVHQLEAGV